MAELGPLKLDRARFRVALEPVAEGRRGPLGVETARFEIATNAGTPFGPLDAIASGGELARFALAMKAALAGREDQRQPVMIFDEVDQGVGGAVAEAVGQRLKRLSNGAQVLVVTHSPQVAARGHAHWKVRKADAGGTTTTTVDALSDDRSPRGDRPHAVGRRDHRRGEGGGAGADRLADASALRRVLGPVAPSPDVNDAWRGNEAGGNACRGRRVDDPLFDEPKGRQQTRTREGFGDHPVRPEKVVRDHFRVGGQEHDGRERPPRLHQAADIQPAGMIRQLYIDEGYVRPQIVRQLFELRKRARLPDDLMTLIFDERFQVHDQQGFVFNDQDIETLLEHLS